MGVGGSERLPVLKRKGRSSTDGRSQGVLFIVDSQSISSTYFTGTFCIIQIPRSSLFCLCCYLELLPFGFTCFDPLLVGTLITGVAGLPSISLSPCTVHPVLITGWSLLSFH